MCRGCVVQKYYIIPLYWAVAMLSSAWYHTQKEMDHAELLPPPVRQGIRSHPSSYSVVVKQHLHVGVVGVRVSKTNSVLRLVDDALGSAAVNLTVLAAADFVGERLGVGLGRIGLGATVLLLAVVLRRE